MSTRAIGRSVSSVSSWRWQWAVDAVNGHRCERIGPSNTLAELNNNNNTETK